MNLIANRDAEVNCYAFIVPIQPIPEFPEEMHGETAVRNVAYSVHVLTGWTDPVMDDEMMEWTESVHEAMAPYSSGDVYVNLLSRDEDDRIPEAYGENYDRLRAVKARWDPENLFSTNQNIEPAN